jgi:hypothetical protein
VRVALAALNAFGDRGFRLGLPVGRAGALARINVLIGAEALAAVVLEQQECHCEVERVASPAAQR